MMRLYLPATLATVAALRAQGQVDPAPAYAVTPALREWYAAADQEELEYAAFTRAAQAALRLLAAAPDQPRRRVVISADAAADPAHAGDRGAGAVVRLRGPVPLTAVAAIHVDAPGAESDVAAAVDAIAAADAGDPQAQFTVAAAEDHELAWYDVSELAQLG